MNEFKNTLLQILKKCIFILISLIIVIVIICGILYLTSNVIQTRNIEIKNEKLQGINIVHLSDFNNKIVKNLSEKVNEKNPDIVVITGDLVDKYKTSENNEEKLLKQFKGITAPIYFVPGDMEHEYNNYEKFKEKMLEMNIHVLENNTEKIEIKNKEITIAGIVDSGFYYGDLENFNEVLQHLREENPDILLSHRAELMELYTNNNFNIVFSGHTHGGYIQIPFVGALFVSNQGCLPKYVEGEYKLKDTTMIVSSGIGIGRFPIRLFNQPEILNVEMKKVE